MFILIFGFFLMLIIEHRINTIESLVKIGKKRGVEIDLRSYKTKIVLEHEPFLESVSFESWLEHYDHKFLILNIKEERIEYKVMKILKVRNIKNYFFLDSTIPMIHNLNKENFFDIALRVSHYESSENFIGLVKNNILNKWLWLDTINGLFPLSLQKLKNLKNIGYKMCLVCPQLPMGKNFKLDDFELYYKKYFKYIDAICTKNTNFWSKYED